MRHDLENYKEQDKLPDGSTVHVRSVAPQDKARLVTAFKHQSEDSIYNRFMMYKTGLSEAELAYFTELDFEQHVAIAVYLSDGTGVAIGRFVIDQEDPTTAEIAVSVDDAHHNRGIGSLLLRHLAGIATTIGISTLHADVLDTNFQMLHLINHAGSLKRRAHQDGIWQIDIDLSELNV